MRKWRGLGNGWRADGGSFVTEVLTVVLLVVFFYDHLLPNMSLVDFHPMLLRAGA